MKPQPEQRAVVLGRYIVENKATVRSAAGKFGISKSTVHMDIQKENV
ncbi:MAG: sporulation transcriptional regulator SpoIIID [Ruminococcus sp.]|nr:sporulation transcriptional regulator SpoIIID [Ruminococcus sp.]